MTINAGAYAGQRGQIVARGGGLVWVKLAGAKEPQGFPASYVSRGGFNPPAGPAPR